MLQIGTTKNIKNCTGASLKSDLNTNSVLPEFSAKSDLHITCFTSTSIWSHYPLSNGMCFRERNEIDSQYHFDDTTSVQFVIINIIYFNYAFYSLPHTLQLLRQYLIVSSEFCAGIY